MKLYKLTDQNNRTYNYTQWGEGAEHTADGLGPLCTHHWLHAYTDPYLAIILNSVHANFHYYNLWEAEGDVGVDDCGLKVGCTKLKTVKQIPIPEITAKQKVAFAALCVLETEAGRRDDRRLIKKWLKTGEMPPYVSCPVKSYKWVSFEVIQMIKSNYTKAYNVPGNVQGIARLIKPLDLIALVNKAVTEY